MNKEYALMWGIITIFWLYKKTVEIIDMHDEWIM